MESSHQKRLSLAAIVLVVILISVFVGFRWGITTADSSESLASSIDNKDSGKPSDVDFSAFWKAWNVINDRYVGTTTPDQDRVYGAIQGMVASLGDPYTVFFPPTDNAAFESEISGTFEGVGMQIDINADNQMVVSSLIKGSPAENAGIKAGDAILFIDGVDTSNMSTDQAVAAIRGKAGTQVKLTLGRVGVKAPFVVTVTRATINVPTVTTTTETPSGAGSTGSANGTSTVAQGDGLRSDGIFVITLASFTSDSANLFREALKQFVASGSHKLVLDLRGNPGGYLEAAVDMASWFLPSGKTVVTESFGHGIPDDVYTSKGYNIFSSQLKMVILVDGGSASAAEILSGALSENGVAKLVGEKTFGKGSVQELVSITPDTSLKVTIAKWLTPLGHWISKVGITPDYVVPMTADDVKAGRDSQMDKAVQLLSAQP